MNIKKLAASVFVVTMLLGTTSMAFAEANESVPALGSPDSTPDADNTDEQGLLYTLSEDGRSYSVSCPEEKREILSGDIIIPAEFNGKPVYMISESGFQYCKNITSVTIEDGISVIGFWAFIGCDCLETVNIPQSVKEISDSAFSHLKSLTAINVDENNENYCDVDGNLFNHGKTILRAYASGKTETSYVIPDSVIQIAYAAFARDYDYESSAEFEIVIPNSVKTIGAYAFEGCPIKSLHIPESVTLIEWDIFRMCYGLESVTVDENNPNYCIEDDVLFTKDMKVLVNYLPYNTRKTYNVPAGVERIESDAISFNQDIEFFALPEGMTAFENIQNCWNLVSFSIPKSVTHIEGISGLPLVKTIKYAGTKDDWTKITIARDVDDIIALAHIYCTDGTYLATSEDSTAGNPFPVAEAPEEIGDNQLSLPLGIDDSKIEDLTVDSLEALEGASVVFPKDAGLDGATVVVDPKPTNAENVKGSGTSVALDITFKRGGEEIQPEAEVEVKIALPNSMKDKNEDEIYVYHIGDNGLVERIRARVDEFKNVIFNAVHFSTYVITETEYKESTAPDTGTSSSSGSTSSAPSTSDTSSEPTSSDTSSEPVSSTSGYTESETSTPDASSTAPTNTESNPSTGVALSVLPIVAAISAVIVIKKKK